MQLPAVAAATGSHSRPRWGAVLTCATVTAGSPAKYQQPEGHIGDRQDVTPVILRIPRAPVRPQIQLFMEMKSRRWSRLHHSPHRECPHTEPHAYH